MLPFGNQAHFVSVYSRMAYTAYRLACLGPLSFLVFALVYPPQDPNALPSLPWQIIWRALCVSSPIGAAMGAISLLQIQRSEYSIRGGTHAQAAIVVGLLASLSVLLGTPELNGIRRENHRGYYSSCGSHLKQLSLALAMYAQDNDDYFPLPKTWNEGLMPYIKDETVFHCPAELSQAELSQKEASGLGEPSYALNRRLQKMKTAEVEDPAHTVMVFDSIPGKNMAGGIELLPSPPRHPGGHNIGFVDGHVKFVRESEIATLIWKPVREAKPKAPHPSR